MPSSKRTAAIWALMVLAFLALFWAQEDMFGEAFSTFLMVLIPLALGLGALVYFVRRNQAQQAGTWMDLRKSRARRADQGQEKTRFSDVGGLDEAKAQLQDVVSFLKAPERWTAAGARLPRGVLLEGPPGSGKTLIARAVAGEAGVAVFELSASEFVEMFVGVGAARVRDTFDMAAKEAPAVLFIDEIDAIGRRRGSGVGGSHDEREQTLNQLLTCLDGFSPLRRLVVIAATNRADILDQALLRPGRFDLRVTLPPMGPADRLAVLRIHTRGKALAPEVDLAALANRLEGRSAAAIESLTNEAAMRAVRRGAPAVGNEDFDHCIDAFAKIEHRYDAVDAIFAESASQLARPQGRAPVSVKLDDGTTHEGDIVWADAAFVKLASQDGTVILAKSRIKLVRTRAGAAPVADDALQADAFAHARTDVG